MTDKTINYNLNKPTPEDFYNIQDFNENMDTIDTELKELHDKKASKDELNNAIGAIPDPTWENLENKPEVFPPSSHDHSAAEVALGNVDNVKQASKTEFDNHNNDTTKHIESAERTKWNTVDNKVDKVSGKGLSTNDYTTTEKNKLAEIEAGANKYTHPGSGTNPHGTTKSDIGLGNVDNVKQASKAEHDQLASDFSAHQAEKVHQGETHGLRLTDGKLEYFNGVDWVEVKGGGYPVNIVKNVSAKEDNMKVELMWEDPDDVIVDGVTIAEWNHTKVLRKVGSYPLHEEDGELVISSGVRNAYKDVPYSDVGLQNNITYYYAMFPTTTEDVVTISEASRVSAIPTEIKIYGVEIDESNSNPETSVTYTDDAEGFIPANGNNGNFDWGTWENIIKEEFGIRPVVLQNLGDGNAEINYPLQYDDYTKKADGSISDLTGTDGDVMIEFGKPLWWRFNRVGSKLKIQLSSKEFDGAVKHAFEIEKGYNQVSVYPLFLTQIIYLLMFKNLDSQTALGRGKVNSGYTSTGVTDDKSFNHGTSSGGVNVKLLGMEDYWGNRRWWIDGCFFDTSRNILIGTRDFNDIGSGYVNHGLAPDFSGYIDKVQGKNNTGFIPASTGGSSTTYYSDFGLVRPGQLPAFGGNAGDGDQPGAFFLYTRSASTSPTVAFGGRLFYSNGDDKMYIGAYLGVSQSSKLRSISGQTSHNGATTGAFRTLAKANN